MTPGSPSESSLLRGGSWNGFGLALAFRLALRGLLRAPGSSALASSILVLGMAAPVTFFSLLAGSLRHLPVPEGHRVIRVEVSNAGRGGGPVPVTLQDLSLLQATNSFEELGAFRVFQGTLVAPEAAATRVAAAAITPEVLPLLRTAPVLGRIPMGRDAEEGILLGFDLWRDSYGGDPGILGQVVLLNDQPRVIAGVLPEGFGFPFRQNLWVFIGNDLDDPVPVEFVGRLSETASHESASAEVGGMWARGDQFRAPGLQGGVVEVAPFTGGRGERGEGIAFLGLVLVGLALLVIACANVANLLLVRAADRIRSLGVQSALGAGKAQLSAQLFFEALLLAVVGGSGGLLLGWVAVDAIQTALAGEHFGYFWMRMAVDMRAVAFASVLVGGTAVFSGTIPIVRLLKADLQSVLKEGGRNAAMGKDSRWNRGFVGLQLALSCAALVASGLTGQSLARSKDFGRGVASEEILVASLDPVDSAAASNLGWEGRLRALTEALADLPGSRRNALALGAPGYLEPFGFFEIQGREAQRVADQRGAFWNAVTPGYFSLLDLEITSGRNLEGGDRADSPPVAVVSESFVALHLSGEEPLGKGLIILGADTATVFSIVGVVEDIDMGGGPNTVVERIYLPLSQLSPRPIVTLVRSEAGASALAPGLRGAVSGVDPRIPVWSVRALEDAHAFMTRIPRAMAAIAVAGGLGGLLVAAVGLYGLLAFRVRQRRRELGVRLALGADGKRLMWEVLQVAARRLLPAVGVGLGLAWLLAPILGVVLLGLDPRAPLTYLSVAVAFMVVGLGAALVPAYRAATVEPAEVLRGE